MTNGTYALKLVVDVYYQDDINNPKLILPGRGTVTILLKADLTGVCEDGTGGMATMRPCGTTLPPLYTDAVQKVVQITFPDAEWDAPGIPTYAVMGSTTGFDPGSMLTFTKAVSLVGIKLADPMGAWPTYEMTPTLDCGNGMKGEMCFPDIDGDGHPGITAKMVTTGTPPDPGFLSGWEYTPAPTTEADALTSSGAVEAYTGLRTRLAGGGAIGADCKSGSGSADAEDFESRVIDCKTKDGTNCTADQATFVDKNVPIFRVLKKDQTPPATWKYDGLNGEIDGKLNRKPSPGPLSYMVRLGDLGGTVTCDDVRKAAFPAAPTN